MQNHLRPLVDTYEQVQKTRLATENRIRAIKQEKDQPTDINFLEKEFKELKKIEQNLQKEMLKSIKDHPAFEWLSQVKGVSGTLACKLLSFLDIEKAEHPSSFWKYCGLAVVDGEADRVKKGKPLTYSLRAKQVMFLIGKSFLMSNSPFKEIYDKARVKYESKKDWSDLRKHYASMRIMNKIFLTCLHTYWRDAIGLPVSQPYIQAKKGHQDIFQPEDFVEAIKVKKTKLNKRAK